MINKLFLTFLFVSFLTCGVFGQAVYTPERGSAERKAILDTLRIPIEKELKQKIQFNKLKIRYFWTTPQQASGVFAQKFVGQSTDDHEFSKTKNNALSGLIRKPALQADREFF